MKIAVFSDSHGNIDNMKLAVMKTQPDAVVHLGDLWSDGLALAEAFPDIPHYRVRGNCDFEPDAPETLFLDFEGHRVLATHGHRHRVKLGLNALYRAARDSGSELALFGHTHRAKLDESGPILLNPGAAGDPFHPTFAVIDATRAAIGCKIYDIS